MSTMTLQNIRDYVYNWMQIDSSDLPTSTLDTMIAQAWWRIINSERRWSFYEKQATFSTVASQQTYSLAGLTNDTHTWADIYSIESDTHMLRPLSHRHAQRMYAAGNNTSGRSYYFSVRNAAVYLWPIPNSVIVHTVVGWRRPTDWIGDASEPDCPEDFHSLIAQGALYLAYTQQDDPASAEQQRGVFMDALRQIRQQYVDTDAAGPKILNGGTPSGAFPALLRDRADYFG